MTRSLLVAPVLGLLVAPAAWRSADATPSQRRPSTRPASQASSRPAGPTPFQPGVAIDWKNRAVRVDARVVLRAGPLEFFACRPGKEHESILLLQASATHVYMALGLIGLKPGHPPRWDEHKQSFGPPTGDLVDLVLEWRADGQDRSAPAHAWLRQVQYARPPIVRPWVFAGSRRLPDNTLAADHSGHGIALVDQPDSLLALSRNHVSRDAELWVEANTPAIPPKNTLVRLVLTPAVPRPPRVHVDFRGDAHVDGRYCSVADLADLLLLARRLEPQSVQPISLRATLAADAQRLRRKLTALGVPPEAFRFERRDTPSSRPAGPLP